jgi:hypothetical protein
LRQVFSDFWQNDYSFQGFWLRATFGTGLKLRTVPAGCCVRDTRQPRTLSLRVCAKPPNR